MKLDYDPKADAAYVRLKETIVTSTRELDSQRSIDLDERGEIVGIEFITPSQGVQLEGLPHKERLAQLFKESDLPVFA